MTKFLIQRVTQAIQIGITGGINLITSAALSVTRNIEFSKRQLLHNGPRSVARNFEQRQETPDDEKYERLEFLIKLCQKSCCFLSSQHQPSQSTTIRLSADLISCMAHDGSSLMHLLKSKQYKTKQTQKYESVSLTYSNIDLGKQSARDRFSDSSDSRLILICGLLLNICNFSILLLYCFLHCIKLH